MIEAQQSEHAQGRAIASGAFVAAAGLIAALALVYSNATGVIDVAEDAGHQQQAEAALGAVTSARNTIGQTLLIAGTTDDPTLVSAAVVQTAAVLDAMEERILAVADALADPTGLEQDLAVVLLDTGAVLEAVNNGDLDGAWEVAAGASTASFAQVVTDITTYRDGVATRIATAAAKSGTVATASRFMVAFFVPSMAIVIAFVVSTRRRKRELLAIELEQERALNRSKDQLIANLSHELRTPLTGIYTTALTIDDAGFADVDLTRELNDLIIDQSADLNRMVEDLLVTAQTDAGRLHFDLAPTEIDLLLADLEKEFDRFDAEVRYELAPASVIADPGKLQHLLRNIISNAANYGNGHVAVTGKLDDAAYVIEVIDDGPGVAAEVEERMFEPFVHRGNQPLIAGSVGLGLSISKVLAEGMNGHVAYLRTEGQTIFEVTLQTPETPEPSPDSSPSVAGSADDRSDAAAEAAPHEPDRSDAAAEAAPHEPDRSDAAAEAAPHEPDRSDAAAEAAPHEPDRSDAAAEAAPHEPDRSDAAAEAAPDDPNGSVGSDAARLTSVNPSPESQNGNETSTRADLTDIAISDRIRRALEVHGVSSIENLLALSTQDLLAIKGIGAASVAAIERSLAEHGAHATEA